MSRRSVWLGAVLALILVFTAGCGLRQKATEKVTEKAVGGILSAVTGEKVDVEGLGDGGGISIRGEDGQSLNISGETNKVPDGFPLPVYRGWKPEGFVTTTINNNANWTGGFTFSGNAKAVSSQYADELRAMGLEVENMEMEAADDGTYSNNLTVKGTINGKHYAGWLGFHQASGEGSSITVVFGEADADE